MAEIVNDRDVRLQATVPRFGAGGGLGTGILLSASSNTVKLAADGSPSPATVTLTALQMGAPGTVVWGITGGVLTGNGNNSRTLRAADMTADTAIVTVTVSYGGNSYTSSCSVQRVRDGGAGSAGPRGAGHFYVAGSSWSDVVADMATPGNNVVDDVVTISSGTFVMEKRWDGAAWVPQGTVLDGNLLVTGSVTASKVNTNGLIIRDVNGNVILGSGFKLDYKTWIQNLPTSLADISATQYTKLNGIEAGATDGATFGSNLWGQITAANVSTYIASAAIGDAYIGSLSATKITAGAMSADRIFGGSITGSTINIASGNFTVNASTGHAYAFAPLFTAASFNNGSATPNTPSISAVTAGFTTAAAVDVSNNGSGAGAHGVAAAGAGGAYDFYATGAGTNFGPFTGAHDIVWRNEDDAQFGLGDIVVDVECVARGGLSNTLFRVEPSSRPNQPAAVGVLALRRGALADTLPAVFIAGRVTEDVQDEHGDTRTVTTLLVDPQYDAIKDGHQLGAVNALGEGQVNVCGEGGDIAAGDLIVTSSLRGKGMRQADDVVRAYTVARAREACTFSSPHEVKLVACIYLAG